MSRVHFPGIAKISKSSQKLTPNAHDTARPVVSNWSNYDLSPPSTSVIGTANTTPALNFNQPRQKNDYNDAFGKNLKFGHN